MKLFYIMLTLILIGALAVPFFMQGPGGKPIMTVDGVLDDTIADIVPSPPTEMYRWQDEHGVWQFGEQAPETVSAARVAVDSSQTNTMGSEWNVEPVLAGASGAGGRDPVDFQMPNSLSDAYRAAPELMGAAKRAAAALNDRQTDMDDMLEELAPPETRERRR